MGKKGRPKVYGKRVTLGVRIDPELRKVLRIEAGYQDRSMGAVVERALRSAMRQRGWDV